MCEGAGRGLGPGCSQNLKHISRHSGNFHSIHIVDFFSAPVLDVSEGPPILKTGTAGHTADTGPALDVVTKGRKDALRVKVRTREVLVADVRTSIDVHSD